MLDIIAIGDVTIDIFIRLDPVASLECDKNHRHCRLAIPFGTKLGIAEVHRVWGGNSGNIAVGSSRLGLSSALFSEVGDDAEGRLIFNSLRQNKVSTKYFIRDKTEKTNVHYVLNYHAERTILIHHQPRKYHFPSLEQARYIYFSSAAKEGEKMFAPLLRYLHKYNAKLCFNPGTYQLSLGLQKLAPLLRKTNALFLNLEEAQLLLKTTTRNIPQLLLALHHAGPCISVITDGANGAYAYDGTECHYCPIYHVLSVEQTGTGDAFATGFLCALSYTKPITEALRWGTVNSAAVLQHIGPQAGFLTKQKLTAILNANPHFQPRILHGTEAIKDKVYYPKKYKEF